MQSASVVVAWCTTSPRGAAHGYNTATSRLIKMMVMVMVMVMMMMLMMMVVVMMVVMMGGRMLHPQHLMRR